jgi:cytidine deaminase
MTLYELKRTAVSMQERAWCPYSHFPVGAALECADGTVYTGCNLENASYPVGICAERTAMAKAVSEGQRDFRRIVIAGKGDAYCVPCGMCRQFLAEFAPELEIICLNGRGESRTYTLAELLPQSFGGAHLQSAQEDLHGER